MISSTANPHIKFLRSLHLSKGRQASGMFLAEGLKLVGQAFDSNADIQQIIFCPELLISEYGQSLIEKAERLGIETLEVNTIVFESLARKDKPQGIAALVKQNWQKIENIQLKDEKSTWLVIEAIQNPGNLGTVMRTCDATGVSGLLLLPNSTDPYDPAAVKASMGGVFTVPHYNISYAQLSQFINANPKLSVVGTSDKAKQNAFTFAYPNHTLFLIGSERQGLSPELTDLSHQMISIPMTGACDSLNLSVATGIILYEIFNQRSGLLRT